MPENTAAAQRPAPDALTATNVSKWAGFLVGPLLALGVAYGTYRVQSYRLDLLEAQVATAAVAATEAIDVAKHARDEQTRQQIDIARLRDKSDADHAWLMSVAEDLRLFMCSTNRDYCRGRKP